MDHSAANGLNVTKFLNDVLGILIMCVLLHSE